MLEGLKLNFAPAVVIGGAGTNFVFNGSRGNRLDDDVEISEWIWNLIRFCLVLSSSLSSCSALLFQFVCKSLNCSARRSVNSRDNT